MEGIWVCLRHEISPASLLLTCLIHQKEEAHLAPLLFIILRSLCECQVYHAVIALFGLCSAQKMDNSSASVVKLKEMYTVKLHVSLSGEMRKEKERG
jgi:hypothetical protein